MKINNNYDNSGIYAKKSNIKFTEKTNSTSEKPISQRVGMQQMSNYDVVEFERSRYAEMSLEEIKEINPNYASKFFMGKQSAFITEDFAGEYFNGDMPLADLKDKAEIRLREMFDYYTSLDPAENDYAKDIKTVMEDTLESMRGQSIRMAYGRNVKEQESIPAMVYYNSDYHYLSNDAIDMVSKAMKDIGKEYGIDINTDSWKENPAAETLTDFTTIWSARYSSYDSDFGADVDFGGKVPPRGTKVYIAIEKGNSPWKASLNIEYEGEKLQALLGENVKHKTVFDYMTKEEKNNKTWKQLESFFRNTKVNDSYMDIFRYYQDNAAAMGESLEEYLGRPY